jgi:hypothetical protein
VIVRSASKQDLLAPQERAPGSRTARPLDKPAQAAQEESENLQKISEIGANRTRIDAAGDIEQSPSQ